MTSDASASVLIVGAGPTGLTLAVALRHQGVKVRLIDRASARATVSKALAVWSGSLEALAGLGVIDEFLASGTRLNALTVGSGRRRLAALAVGAGIDSPYPFPLLLPQSRTEAILESRAAALGVTVERSVELVGFVQDATGVTATLRRGDGSEETVRTPYLVGADGARSQVRHTLGIEFEGYTEKQTYLLGDVRITGGNLDHHDIYVWSRHGHTAALFPFGRTTWRIFARRTENHGDAPPTLEELQRYVGRHGPPGMRIHDPSWLSVFRINERLAARYRVGRVFLAGDAAHVHSPAGGQGMNTGIQDAVNLGWKLAYVVRGLGDSELLLDSYEAERRPIARAVVAGAAQKLHIAFATNPVVRLMRSIAITVIGNLAVAQKKLQVELSETEIAYRNSALVALGAPPSRIKRTDVGTRARDAAVVAESGQPATLWPVLCRTQHTLLTFEDAAHPVPLDGIAARAGKDLAVARLGPNRDPHGKARNRYHAQPGSWVLVRPDQVVAARGGAGDLAALANYLDRVIGARPPLDGGRAP